MLVLPTSSTNQLLAVDARRSRQMAVNGFRLEEEPQRQWSKAPHQLQPAEGFESWPGLQPQPQLGPGEEGK